MPQEFGREPLLGESYENDLKARYSCKLHSWQAVRVAGYQHDTIYSPLSSMSGNIEAETHVDALLLKTRLEVFVGKRLRGSRVLQNESSKLQRAEPNGKLRLRSKRFEPGIGVPEFLPVAGHRQTRSTPIGRAVIVQNTQQSLIVGNAGMCNAFDVIGIVATSDTGLLNQDAEMSAVDENRCFQAEGPPRSSRRGPWKMPAYGRSG